MFLKSEIHSVFFCSHFSSQKPIVHCSLQWNALPYVGKFDGQAAFGIYSLAATCRHNNTNQTLQPVALNRNTTHTLYNAAMSALRLWPVYGYGQSTVVANLQLQPMYGSGQSKVTAKLWLRSIYGCSHSFLLLQYLCPLQLQFCYI